MSDLDIKIKAKTKELKELKKQRENEKLKAELTTLKTIRELPFFKGKNDTEIIAEIKAKFSTQNLTNFH